MSQSVSSILARPRHALLRRNAGFVVALAVFAFSASPTHAMRRHLRLVKSSPAADAVMAKSPETISLWLSEPAELPMTKIALSTTDGAHIALAPLTRAKAKGAPVQAKLVKPLADGAYIVKWKAASKDGHVVDGTFAFHVAATK